MWVWSSRECQEGEEGKFLEYMNTEAQKRYDVGAGLIMQMDGNLLAGR